MAELTRDEFCERFVSQMMASLSIYAGTEAELTAYAWEIAPTYWEDEDQRSEGPEACAEADIGEWEAEF